jgi:hypothetical protein
MATQMKSRDKTSSGGLMATQRQSLYEPSIVAQTALVAVSSGLSVEDNKDKMSVAALWSMTTENDQEVDDELSKCSKS